MNSTSLKLKSFVTIAMLSSIGFILIMFNFPLPGLPAFLKIDFSDIPALIAVLTMGPVAGILVELFKNVLDFLFISSEIVGNTANFVTGVLFILPVYFIYKKAPNFKGLVVGLVVGTFTMAIGMSVLNWLVFLPIYTYVMNWGTFDLKETIVLGILPFNILKGVLLAAVAIFLMKTMEPWFKKQRAQYAVK